MTLETSKLLRLIEALGDILLEIELGREPSAATIREWAAADMADPSFQRGFLKGMERVLKCKGIPAFLAGEEARLITSHINRIGMTFKISEKESAHAETA